MAKPASKSAPKATSRPARKPVAKAAPKAKPAPRGASPKAAPRVEAKAAAPKVVSTANAMKLKLADEGYQLAKTDAVKYLHSRRQAMFALARRYHLDAEDIEQEGFEVLLTCLRDFNPQHTKGSGEVITVQFNTFFGSRLEGKALELRNRDPEYQARQAHMADMSDADRESFRKDPPLLVQHLDQQTAVQEHLRGEVSSAKRASQTNVALKVAHDSFVEKKLNQLIAQERDDKRRAALLHVKVGGVSSFDEIAYHFGVTDSRASQILNELMDAFYVQRLLDGDLKSVAYDWRKLKLQPKRAQRLVEEAIANGTAERNAELAAAFNAEFPELSAAIAAALAAHGERKAEAAGAPEMPPAMPNHGARTTFADPFTPEENTRYPLVGLEWRVAGALNPLPVSFRSPAEESSGTEPAHITALMERGVDDWPLIVTQDGTVVDGARRLAAAKLRGKEKVLCLVRQVAGESDARILRVVCNMRQIKADKMDLYFAISALSDLGLSQQKIAVAIGTSRPNVIVYAKVKDKATPKLRALFEDGLIQITNASACVDLPAAAQDGLAEFIRRHGPNWGKGPQFNEAYEAAAAGKLSKLSNAQPEPSAPATSAPLKAAAVESVPNLPADPGTNPALVQALRQRQSTLENALRDTETWAQQRESVITRQTQELTELKQQADSLKRELQAHDLLKYGDDATVAGLMKEIKSFYTLVERLASAAYQVDRAGKSLRGQPLTYKQAHEVQQQVDALEASLGVIRVELAAKARRSTT